jgi:hypothetical protein
MVQVAISTARIDVGRRGRMRIGVKDKWLLVECAWGSRSSMPGMISQSTSCLWYRIVGSLALISSLGWESLLGGGVSEGGRWKVG